MSTLAVIAPPETDVPTCCAPPARETAADPSHGTKCHFSLNVSDMGRSIAFYEALFGTPPAKRHHDYAKFELSRPPLVFSLVPNPPAGSGALSHFGFPLDTLDEVEETGRRLAAAGLDVSCQKGTVCGYARQDKIWIADPDHNYWEIYVVHEEVDPESVRSGFDGVRPVPTNERTASPALAVLSNGSLEMAMPQAASLWEHRVMQPLPDRIPHDDGTLDVVRLEGTFNDDFAADARSRLLADALRALKPGGEVHVHGLVSDVPVTGGLPVLPGVAALVKRIPTEGEPMGELQYAGFTGLRVTKLPASPVFHNSGVEMREIKLTAMKPAPSADDSMRQVVYKGPFAQAVDDFGNVYPRGRRIEVTRCAWDHLGRGASASQFLFLGDEARDASSCG